MKRQPLVILIIIALIGCVLFADQVLAFFRGMGPLEAIQTIWQFVLHVTVGTICAYMVYTLPEIVKPWLKTLRWKQRQARRLPPGRPAVHAPRLPRLSAAQQAQQFWLMMRANGRAPSPRSLPHRDAEPVEPTIRIKW